MLTEFRPICYVSVPTITSISTLATAERVLWKKSLTMHKETGRGAVRNQRFSPRWLVASGLWLKHYAFWGTYRVCHLGLSGRKWFNLCASDVVQFAMSLPFQPPNPCFSALKMEAAYSSQTSVTIFPTTWHQVQRDGISNVEYVHLSTSSVSRTIQGILTALKVVTGVSLVWRSSQPEVRVHVKSDLLDILQLMTRGSVLLREISTRSRKIIFLGGTERPVRGADNFTAICEPIF
jgi:hypothetical protein